MARMSTAMLLALTTAVSARSLMSLRGGAIKLDTDDKKALYALGCNVGRQVGDLDCFSESEVDVILFGMKDTISRIEPRVNLMEHMPKVKDLFEERQKVHLAKIEAKSLEALANAAKEKGATATASGLVIKTLKEGDGESPTINSKVRVHYTGTLADGTTFDSSVKRGEPVEFALKDVVQGWQEGIVMMKAGGKAKLTIPAALGYGEEGKSLIPPKATLIFEVELLAVLADEAGADGDAASEDEEEILS